VAVGRGGGGGGRGPTWGQALLFGVCQSGRGSLILLGCCWYTDR
jgi:hypothetical protein